MDKPEINVTVKIEYEVKEETLDIFDVKEENNSPESNQEELPNGTNESFFKPIKLERIVDKGVISQSNNDRIQNENVKQTECIPNGSRTITKGKSSNTGKNMINNKFKCDVCDRSYNRKENIRDHIKTKHTVDKPFKCQKCNSSFGWRSNLVQHMAKHTKNKLFKCNLCDSSFVWESILRRHQATHTLDKSFKCEICYSSFKWKNNLKEHIATHSKVKLFKCDECHKKFKHQRGLKRHSVMHTGERPFKCEKCDACFAFKFVLNHHMKIHTRGKLDCDVCEKKIVNEHRLKAHMMTHVVKRIKREKRAKEENEHI